MRLHQFPPSALSQFARLHQISLNGVSISDLGPPLGFGILLQLSKHTPGTPLLIIDRDHILSAEHVELAGKSDSWVRDMLQACCGLFGGVRQSEEAENEGLLSPVEDSDEKDEQFEQWGRNARLMILLFLAVMFVRGAEYPEQEEEDMSAAEKTCKTRPRRKSLGIGTGGIWSEYIKILPNVSLPTTWTEQERSLLKGTSLESAVPAKMATLEREYHALQHFTKDIKWCRKIFWPQDEDMKFTLKNWIQLDSWFRSRVLELPEKGPCLVPFLDMANHSDDANAYYSLSRDGDVELLLSSSDPDYQTDFEVRINYGAHKSSAEQLFTYGFMSPSPSNSPLWLAIPFGLPADDPLSPAKATLLTSAPTLKLIDLFTSSDSDSKGIAWVSPAIHLLTTSSDDGLQFQLAQHVTGKRELKCYWRPSSATNKDEGKEIHTSAELAELLEHDPLWDVYHLRAVVTALEIVEGRMVEVEKAEQVVEVLEQTGRMAGLRVGKDGEERKEVSIEVADAVRVLRGREKALLGKSLKWLESERDRLVDSNVVQKYLKDMQEGVEDDEKTTEDEDLA